MGRVIRIGKDQPTHRVSQLKLSFDMNSIPMRSMYEQNLIQRHSLIEPKKHRRSVHIKRTSVQQHHTLAQNDINQKKEMKSEIFFHPANTKREREFDPVDLKKMDTPIKQKSSICDDTADKTSVKIPENTYKATQNNQNFMKLLTEQCLSRLSSCSPIFKCFCLAICLAILAILIAVLIVIVVKTLEPSKSTQSSSTTFGLDITGLSTIDTSLGTSTAMDSTSSESITTESISTEESTESTTSAISNCTYLPCQNNGTCLSTNICNCSSGWAGPQCNIPVCSPRCPSGKRCVAGNICQTRPACYYGLDKVSLTSGDQKPIRALRVGDRVRNFNLHDNTIIEDEIVMIMDKQTNVAVIFHVIKSIQGHHLRLTSRHTLPVFDTEDNQTKIIRANEATMKHHLFTTNGKIPIASITLEIHRGFYSPLTLTGFLMVNNVSTSVFSDNYNVSQETFQIAFTPIRWYYLVTRFLYGEHYDPFQTKIENGLHPVIAVYKNYYRTIRLISLMIPYIIPTTMIYFMLILCTKRFAIDRFWSFE